MTDLTTIARRMADEVSANVPGLIGIRQHLHRPPAGLSSEQCPYLSVWLRRATLRFVDTEPTLQSDGSWRIDYAVADVVGTETGGGNAVAAQAVDTGQAIAQVVREWGAGIPDGEGGTFEEFATPVRLTPEYDGAVLRIRLEVDVESLAF